MGGWTGEGKDTIIWDGKIKAKTLDSETIAVSSTTKVTNLNADLLDGKDTGTSGNVIPLLDGTNAWSGVQTFNDGKLAVRNPANTKSVTIKAGAQTSDITWTFPVSGNDTFVGASTLSSGSYTPTVTNSTNTDTAVTVTGANYTLNNGLVTVSGRFTADPTTPATATSFELSVPIASSFTNVYDAAGTAVCGNIASMCAEIIGVPRDPGATAKIQWKATDVTSQTWSYIYQYRITPSSA